MKKIIIIFGALTLFLAGCGEEEGTEDQNSEVSCSATTGAWVITAATCNGAAVSDIGNISITFNSATSASQSQGETACTSSFNLDLAHGGFTPSLDLTGNGNLSCSAAGASVSSCTSATNNCDSTTNITGFFNSYSTCVITDGVMSLSRTVSSTNNPNSTSYCADGEEESISLSEATAAPVDPPVTSTASLDISGADPYDYGSVSNGSNQSQSLTMVNSGSASATSIAVSGLAAPFSFLGGAYPGTGGTCGATLAAGASCTLVVDFAPTVTGAAVDSIDVSYNDGSTTQNFTHGVQGTGTSASLANLIISNGPTYDYGTRAVGSTASFSFTVTNTGSSTATSIADLSSFVSPFSYQGGSYPGTGGTCITTLAPAGTCTIVVEFAPIGAGMAADTINLIYNDGVSAQAATRNIQGTGATPANLIISETDPFDFGSVSVGFTNSHSFTVTNTGGVSAVAISETGLSAPFMFVGGAYPGTSGTCTTNVPAGGNCILDIQFAPSLTGVSNDTIDLSYNNGVTVQSTTRDVTGTGIP